MDTEKFTAEQLKIINDNYLGTNCTLIMCNRLITNLNFI